LSAPGARRGTAPSASQTLGRPEARTISLDLCTLQNLGRSPSRLKVADFRHPAALQSLRPTVTLRRARVE